VIRLGAVTRTAFSGTTVVMTESTENGPESLLKVPPARQRKGDGPEDLIKATEQMREDREAAMTEPDPVSDR
jgi:hypothetical protein